MTLNYQEYKQFWLDHLEELVKVEVSSLNKFQGLSIETKTFLANVGFPALIQPPLHKSPYFNFYELEEPLCLTSDKLPRTTGNYLIFGTRSRFYISKSHDDKEDILCINLGLQNDIILMLANENYKVQFVNQTIEQFAESLYFYAKIVKKYGLIYGSDKSLYYAFTRENINELKEGLRNIDIYAVNETSFWNDELNRLNSFLIFYESKLSK